MVTFEQVRNDTTIIMYIQKSDEVLKQMGYNEHSLAHVGKCVESLQWILTELGYDERTIELGKIAAFMHDIGNMVNRKDHAHHGAILAFSILDKMGMNPAEIVDVVTAIGHHDEDSAHVISAINAALILADKSDVRHTRVRHYVPETLDIHDRVNYAIKKAEISIDKEKETITLDLTLDNNVSSVTDYFEIFLNRMLLCRKAAGFFELSFKLRVNGDTLL